MAWVLGFTLAASACSSSTNAPNGAPHDGATGGDASDGPTPDASDGASPEVGSDASDGPTPDASDGASPEVASDASDGASHEVGGDASDGPSLEVATDVHRDTSGREGDGSKFRCGEIFCDTGFEYCFSESGIGFTPIGPLCRPLPQGCSSCACAKPDADTISNRCKDGGFTCIDNARVIDDQTMTDQLTVACLGA
jgi:hypothetical protein